MSRISATAASSKRLKIRVSLLFMSVSRSEALSTPSTVRPLHVQPRTFNPSAVMRWAIALPIRPKPIMPIFSNITSSERRAYRLKSATT